MDDVIDLDATVEASWGRFAWEGQVGVIVEGNDVLACAYRLTRADMSALRKRGLRRFSRHTSAYRLVLPVSEATHAAAVAASVLRDVFSVIHPAFLKGGGFSVGGQPRSE